MAWVYFNISNQTRMLIITQITKIISRIAFKVVSKNAIVPPWSRHCLPSSATTTVTTVKTSENQHNHLPKKPNNKNGHHSHPNSTSNTQPHFSINSNFITRVILNIECISCEFFEYWINLCP